MIPGPSSSYDDEGLDTTTSREQIRTERIVQRARLAFHDTYQNSPRDCTTLGRSAHLRYLHQNLLALPPNATSFCHTRPWAVFWTVHPLDLLDSSAIKPSQPSVSPASDSQPSAIWTPALAHSCFSFFQNIIHEDGGFGGDFGSSGHALPTYAAVMSILTVGARSSLLAEAFSVLDPPSLRRFWLSLKITDSNDLNYGSFATCVGGEVDTRAVYCILAAADILGMLPDPELTAGLVPWLLRCQGYDGGFGAFPGAETHGGYTFTAIASLYLAGAGHLCDLDALERWTATKQMENEGGFCGRTLKLVDSCYSYWVGAVAPMVALSRQQGASYVRHSYQQLLSEQLSGLDSSGTNNSSIPNLNKLVKSWPLPLRFHPSHRSLGWGFSQSEVQAYILACCQDMHNGGFRDKPGVPVDIYHSCNSISGIATAQGARPIPRLPGPPTQYTWSPQDNLAVIGAQLTPIVCNPNAARAGVLSASQNDKSDSFDVQLAVAVPVTKGDVSLRNPPPAAPVLSPLTQHLIKLHGQPQTVVFGNSNDLLQINNPIFNISQNVYSASYAHMMELASKNPIERDVAPDSQHPL